LVSEEVKAEPVVKQIEEAKKVGFTEGQLAGFKEGCDLC
jgi:hypothetical protein